jgi:quercetin dioxygenase-like cupin family protein
MATTSDGLVVLGPGEGEAFPAMDIVRKATAEQTGGWGVVVVTGVPGEGGRTHVHVGEAEAFYLLEGQIEFLGATTTTRLDAGAFVLVPPDTEHGVRIVGDSPAAWLAIWPSRLEGLPEELERLSAEGAGPAATAAARRRHGIVAGGRR